VENNRPSRVLLISLGQLNGLLLKLLARTPGIDEIMVGTRAGDRATPTLNLARMSAGAEGFFPTIRAVPFDLNETEAAAEALSELRPDVTFAAPSLQSWWVLDQMPHAAAAPLQAAGFGAWLPFQLLPMKRLMTAWKQSGLETPIIGAPYPDVVNPILDARGLAPTCGVGNLAEMVPKLQWRVAEYHSAPPEHVKVWLVAHHALEKYVYSSYNTSGAEDDEPPPYKLHIEVAGRELDPNFDVQEALFEPYPLPEGLDFNFLTAGSAVRLMTAFLKQSGEKTFTHVPAPDGLPGGYPVMIEDGSIGLDLPPDWTRKEAVEANRASHRWDGIETIEDDGTVEFTDVTAGILRETLGYDWPRLPFDEVRAAADELRRRFDAYTQRFSVGWQR
jgi:hypothetical protein